jgi:hypothetical protein
MSNISSSDMDWGEALDASFFDAFTKKIMMPISNYPAFKMGLIDGSGNIKRPPRTRYEKRALSFLDRLALLFKRYNAARSFQIFNDYRLARLNPAFIQAVNRGMSLRFSRYYDPSYGWEIRPLNEEAEKRKNKRIKASKEYHKELREAEDKKRKMLDTIEEFFVEMEENIEGD